MLPGAWLHEPEPLQEHQSAFQIRSRASERSPADDQSAIAPVQLSEALAHAKGKRELRTTELPPPPRPVDGGGIKRLRTRLKMSQAVFARCLNVSTKLVQAWEAGRRTPDGPALLLVRLVEKNPALLLSSWTLVKRRRALAKRGLRNVTRGRRTRQLA